MTPEATQPTMAAAWVSGGAAVGHPGFNGRGPERSVHEVGPESGQTFATRDGQQFDALGTDVLELGLHQVGERPECDVRPDEQSHVGFGFGEEIAGHASPPGAVGVVLAVVADGGEEAGDGARRRHCPHEADAVVGPPGDTPAGLALTRRDTKVDVGPLVGAEHRAEGLDVVVFGQSGVAGHGQRAEVGGVSIVTAGEDLHDLGLGPAGEVGHWPVSARPRRARLDGHQLGEVATEGGLGADHRTGGAAHDDPRRSRVEPGRFLQSGQNPRFPRNSDDAAPTHHQSQRHAASLWRPKIVGFS
jgi:hypothetical protein